MWYHKYDNYHIYDKCDNYHHKYNKILNTTVCDLNKYC